MPVHQARKRFGQNFLVDPHYVEKIVDAIAPRPGDNLVEIGPGRGALTRELARRAGHLVAIEIDRDLAFRLTSEFPPESLTLHVGDALDFDFAKLGPALRVVGNLPYNISSPLLFHLAQFASQLTDLHVMLQKEVVARMTAPPASADYGRLTVMLQANFRVVRLFTVPPGAFSPAPRVESAVARLVPLGAARLQRCGRRAVRAPGRRRIRPAAQDVAQCAVDNLRCDRAGGCRRGSRCARRDARGRRFRPARQRARGAGPD